MGYQGMNLPDLPISAGKTKMLWDAIRTAGVGPDGQPLPPGTPQTPDGQVATPPPQAAPPPDNILPPKPPLMAGPPSVDTPNGPAVAPSLDPNAAATPPPSPGLIRRSTMPPPASTAPTGPTVDPNSLPSNQRVQQLQGQIDQSLVKPTLMQRFKNALPALIASGVAVAARAPSALPGVAQATQTGIAERDKQRAALIQQEDAANQTRAQEYAAQQRALEMQSVANIGAGSRQTVATTNAGAKVDTANIGAGAKTDVANITGQNRLDVQDKKNQGSYADAIVGANGRIQSSKYAVDAALARQQIGINATANRQQAGFEHTDTKPTADEDRRADLSKSLDVLSDRLADISSRRPELFGPVAGRMTKLRQAAGTSDPDVAELKSIQENLGQISLGAHSMRNAGHIATAADAMANMYNSPEAYRAGLSAGKASADTMQTITRPSLVKPPANAPKPKKPVGTNNDPLGIR